LVAEWPVASACVRALGTRPDLAHGRKRAVATDDAHFGHVTPMLAEMRLDASTIAANSRRRSIAGQPHQSSLIDQKLDQPAITTIWQQFNLTNCWVD
jgi:hypothetical protein